MPNFAGRVFEDICRQYLWRVYSAALVHMKFLSLGRWWGINSKAHTQEQIDLMGEEDKLRALFCECKWTNEKADCGVLDGLVRKSKLFSYTRMHYCLFSKSGFAEGCEAAAKEMGNVTLITLDKMLKDWEGGA